MKQPAKANLKSTSKRQAKYDPIDLHGRPTSLDDMSNRDLASWAGTSVESMRRYRTGVRSMPTAVRIRLLSHAKDGKQYVSEQTSKDIIRSVTITDEPKSPPEETPEASVDECSKAPEPETNRVKSKGQDSVKWFDREGNVISLDATSDRGVAVAVDNLIESLRTFHSVSQQVWVRLCDKVHTREELVAYSVSEMRAISEMLNAVNVAASRLYCVCSNP